VNDVLQNAWSFTSTLPKCVYDVMLRHMETLSLLHGKVVPVLNEAPRHGYVKVGEQSHAFLTSISFTLFPRYMCY